MRSFIIKDNKSGKYFRVTFDYILHNFITGVYLVEDRKDATIFQEDAHPYCLGIGKNGERKSLKKVGRERMNEINYLFHLKNYKDCTIEEFDSPEIPLTTEEEDDAFKAEVSYWLSPLLD